MANSVYLLYKFLTELLIATAMFVYAFERRKYFVLRLILSVAACVGVSSFYTLQMSQLLPIKILRYAVIFFAVSLAAFICFNVNYRTALFSTVSGYAAQYFASRASQFVEDVFLSGMSQTVIYAVYIAITLAVYAAFYFIFARRLKGMRDMTVNRGDILLLCIFIIFVSIVINVLCDFEDLPSIPAKISHMLYGKACCVLILVLQYGIFKNAIAEKEKRDIEHMREMERKNYEFTKETIDVINIKCHDLKHRLSGLNERVSDEEIDDLKKRLTIYDTSVKTGNDDLDLVIAEKSLFFEKNDIEFTFMGDAEKLGFMRPMDIYSLFGNALDNAIEAACLLPESERAVSLSAKNAMGLFSVHVENPYAGELIVKGDSFKSTKGNEAYHGFGVRSIKLTVEKYGGEISIKTEDNIFALDMVFTV